MSLTIFFVPELSAGVLSEEESLHAVKVLRMKEGEWIALVDGKGTYCEAKITLAHPKRCAFTIISSVENFDRRNFYLHIAIAPTKNIERLEWFLEKITEIGVDEITPILCQNSERKIIKFDRLEKIVVSACKQSVKARFPKLNELTPLGRLIDKAAESDKFIAHCWEGEKIKLGAISAPSNKILILIGPEGDFSKEEVALAETNGFVSVALGESRLRTETAGVFACSLFNILKA